MVNNNNYITIQGWMVNDLKLNGNELMLYSLVYGFSQDGASWYTGSLSYTMDWLGVSKPTAIKLFKSLVGKGLFIKESSKENNVSSCRYMAVSKPDFTENNDDNGGGKVDDGGKETLQGVVKKLYRGGKETLLGGGKETLPNNTNIDNTIYNNIDINTKNAFEKFNEFISAEAPRVKKMEQPITVEQFLKLKSRFNTAEIVDGLKRMQNWKPLLKKNISAYSTFLNWFGNDELKTKKTEINNDIARNLEEERSRAIINSASFKNSATGN